MGRHRTGWGMRKSLLFLGAAGLGLAAWLIAAHDAAAIGAAVAAVGWGLGLICLVRVLPILCDAIGWRVLFPVAWRPAPWPTFWIRWVSESVNALLPVAQIGGEVVRSRLISRRSVVPEPAIGGAQAAASVVADLTTGMVGTMMFSVTGVVLLLQRTTSEEVAGALYWAMAAMAGMLLAFLAAQRSGLLTGVTRKVAGAVGGSLARAVAGGTQAFDAALAEIYRDRAAFAHSAVWRLASWLVGAAEVWLALTFLGVDISLADALMIESVSVTVRSAAFAVPGGLGLQEGSLLLLGGLVGIPPETALALALIKRVREVAVGLPALALWWAIETRTTLRQRA